MSMLFEPEIKKLVLSDNLFKELKIEEIEILALIKSMRLLRS